MAKYLIFLTFFLAIQKAYCKKSLADCYRPFLQTAEYKSLWQSFREGAKNYRSELKEYGPKRLFIKPTSDNNHLIDESKALGILFQDPSHMSVKWFFNIERRVLQAIPKRVTRWRYGEPYEVSPFRAIIHKIDHQMAPGGWRLSIPSEMIITLPPIVTFWGSLYLGSKKIGDYIDDFNYRESVWGLIQTDYRLVSIKRKLENGELENRDNAITEGINLLTSYNLYFELVKEFESQGYFWASPELTAALFDEKTFVTIAPVFERVLKYFFLSQGDLSDLAITEEMEKIDFELFHKLVRQTHLKIFLQQGVREYIQGKSYLPSVAALLDNDFARRIISYQQEGLTQEEVIYWLQDDFDAAARMEELKIMGIKYKHPKKSGEYISLDDFRDEAIYKIEKLLKERKTSSLERRN